MQFTKTLTFDKVLTDCLSLQEKLLDHFSDIPLVSTNTKSYKDVSETVIAQLKIVFDTYVLSNAAISMDQRNERDQLLQELNQINYSQNHVHSNNNQQQQNIIQSDLSSVLSQKSNVNIGHAASQNAMNINQNSNQQLIKIDNSQIMRVGAVNSLDYQHQLQKTSTSIHSLNDNNHNLNHNHNQFNNNNAHQFLQTQELQVENDYLKKQVNALKTQIDERVQEQKQMMEETQTKDMELRELIEMVRQYEGQIRELQDKLEEQIYLHEQRESAKIVKQSSEIQAQQEIQQVKLLFQEFILVKDEIEKNLEEIVKKVLEKEDQQQQYQMTFEGTASTQSNHEINDNKPQLFTSVTTLQKFQEGFSNRKIQDIMRCEISEVKELLEVIKDLKNLINQMLQEKKSLSVQLQSELDLRGQIEQALHNQELESLSSDLLIMKIKTLEHVINGIQSIFNNPTNNLESAQVNQQSTQYLIYQQLKLFSTEQLDEKVRLQERLRFVENQNSQLNDDLQNLLTRVEECERENTDMRISGEKRIEEEKIKLLAEVEEIRQREEKLEVEIQQKLEEEIIRMQVEQEKELNEKFIESLASIIRVNSQDKDTHMKDFEQAVRYTDLKFRTLLEKIDVLTENKELLMKERMIFEERMTEFSYENQMATKQIEQMHVQLQNTANSYQQEIESLREERDQINQSSNMLMTKIRQTVSELHEVREEREKLRKEVINLQEIIDNFDRRGSIRSTMQNSAVSSQNQYLITSRPPINNKNENSLSPDNKHYSEYSARGPTTAVPQARKQPIQIYNSVLNSNSKDRENELITPQYQGSLVSSQMRSSLDEKQLTNLIQDYKSENQKFSQKVQELQKKIQNTAQLSPYNKTLDKQNNFTQSQRAASSRPLNQRNNNTMMNSQVSSNAKSDLNKLYFSTINTNEAPSARLYKNEYNQQQLNSGRSSNQRTLSCSLKKKQQ